MRARVKAGERVVLEDTMAGLTSDAAGAEAPAAAPSVPPNPAPAHPPQTTRRPRRKRRPQQYQRPRRKRRPQQSQRQPLRLGVKKVGATAQATTVPTMQTERTPRTTSKKKSARLTLIGFQQEILSYCFATLRSRD